MPNVRKLLFGIGGLILATVLLASLGLISSVQSDGNAPAIGFLMPMMGLLIFITFWGGLVLTAWGLIGLVAARFKK